MGARMSRDRCTPVNLKNAGASADGCSMVFCVQRRREVKDAHGIQVLHLSLNAPVIAIDALPVGPARAGIALCRDSAGTLDLRIAVRSLRTGQLAVYAPGGSIAAGEPIVDAALAFAEGMGFLFDEDEVAVRGEGSEDAVAALWRDLVEEVPERLRSRATEADPEGVAPAAEPEPALEVAVVADASQALAVRVESLREVAVAPVLADPAAVLSKFRIIRGGIAAPLRPAEPVVVGEEPVVAPCDSQDSRIRLLSRF